MKPVATYTGQKVNSHYRLSFQHKGKGNTKISIHSGTMTTHTFTLKIIKSGFIFRNIPKIYAKVI